MRDYLFLFFLISASSLKSDCPYQSHQKMHDSYRSDRIQADSLLKKAESSPTMTGNWNGGRLYLQDHGVSISSSFVTDSLGNPVGGHAHGFAYAGSLGLSLEIDFEKAVGWTGFNFYSSVVWRTGTSLSQTKIHNQFPVQQVYGSQTIKLNELYLQQSFSNQTIALKGGRLDAGNDFLASPLYGEFVSNAFDGNPVAIFNNFASFTAYPNASWGAYLAICPIDSLLFKFAVYNANSKIFLNRYHGLNFTFKSTNGTLWITEWAYLLNPKAMDEGLKGNYKVGFVYQTGNAQNFYDGMVRGDFCYYFLFDQMIYRPNGPGTTQGLTPFISLLFTPKNRNLFPFFCMGGLVYEGLFPSRPKDTTNIGFAYGKYSADLAFIQRVAKNNGLIGPFGNQPQTYETVLEFNHWFQVYEWLTITPDIQYIFNPQGYGTIQNAFVLGAQIGIVL